MVVGERALAGLRLADADPGRLRELAQRVGGLAVDGAAAADDQRAARPRSSAAASASTSGSGQRAPHAPDALLEQLVRELVRLGLHVLRERQRHRARLGRVGQHAHGAEQRGHELLGPLDPVPELRHRAERVVDRVGERAVVLELLEHGAGPARGEHVAREQEHGQPVDRRERGAGDHVGRARADATTCTRASAAGSSGARRRRRCAPSPARCGRGRRAARPAPRAAPGRRRRRCRGRRCRSSPAISRCWTPSRSLYWTLRNRTSACATVSLILAPRLRHRESRVHLLVGPAVADPGVIGVIHEVPLADAAGHHVEVVEVVAGRGHRRAVIPARHVDPIAAADLRQQLHPVVHALVGEPAAGDLVVVDLLELVVPVRGIRAPVAVRREHLDGDQLVALEGLDGGEVVHLAARVAGAAQLHRHVRGGAVAGGEAARGGRGGNREAALARDLHVRADRRVDEVGDRGEHALAAFELERLAVDRHGARPAQRQHDHLVAAGVEGVVVLDDPQSACTSSIDSPGTSTSSAVGIASAQASRPATIAPAALQKRIIRSRSQLGEQTVAERAAERVARAEAVDDLDRRRRHLDGLAAALREHAARPALADHERDVGARRAVSHSSSLPTATSA